MSTAITREDISEAKQLGSSLARSLSTSQIRKFLSQVNKFRHLCIGITEKRWEEISPQILMLQPRFAYQIAKDKNLSRSEAVIHFKNIVLKKLEKIRKPEDFMHFALFIESVVAYHKEAGGRDN